MQTERVTFLTTPSGKANLASRAAAHGISIGEYVRRRIEEDEEMTVEQEAEMAALVAEVNLAIPEMLASFDHMSQTLRETREEMDRALREAGLRN